MGKKKKKKTQTLGSLPEWASNLGPQGNVTRNKLAVLILSVGAGVVAAQVMGNHPRSTFISLLTAAGGIYTNNMYLTAAGATMFASVSANVNSPDFKSGAKARLEAFFKTFKEKFKLANAVNTAPGTEQTETTSVNGFGETLSVYSNPLALEQGMNALNEIERQLDQMNGTGEDQEISDLPDREL